MAGVFYSQGATLSRTLANKKFPTFAPFYE